MKKVAVIILGYNHERFLVRTLDAVQKQSHTHYTVFFLDNASQDNSYELVTSTYPQVIAKKNTVNQGYTGAYNQAVKEAFDTGFEACVLLNPDVIVDFYWLEELEKSAYQNKKVGLVQSKLYLWQQGQPTKILNSAGNVTQFLGLGYCGEYLALDTKKNTGDTLITSVSGASIFIKKNLYEKIGNLDDQFFAYLEDQDLSWRALLFGFNNMCSQRSIAWHDYDFHKNNESNFKFFLLERNRLLFLVKNFSWSYLLLIFPAFVVLEAGILMDALFKGYFIKKMNSYVSVVKNLAQILKQRKPLQAGRIRSDKEMLPYLVATIDSPLVNSFPLRIANYFFKGYFKLIVKLYNL